jgi:limonene-1,2-epoxide hydrolase
MNADQIVRDFAAAWGRCDTEAILAAFTEDAVYHNIPMPACNGLAEIREFLASFLGPTASAVHFEIRHQIVNGNIVMNERVDSIVMQDQTIALPVCGIFELNDDGKITAWRDYFDMSQFAGA